MLLKVTHHTQGIVTWALAGGSPKAVLRAAVELVDRVVFWRGILQRWEWQAYCAWSMCEEDIGSAPSSSMGCSLPMLPTRGGMLLSLPCDFPLFLGISTWDGRESGPVLLDACWKSGTWHVVVVGVHSEMPLFSGYFSIASFLPKLQDLGSHASEPEWLEGHYSSGNLLVRITLKFKNRLGGKKKKQHWTENQAFLQRPPRSSSWGGNFPGWLETEWQLGFPVLPRAAFLLPELPLPHDRTPPSVAWLPN